MPFLELIVHPTKRNKAEVGQAIYIGNVLGSWYQYMQSIFIQSEEIYSKIIYNTYLPPEGSISHHNQEHQKDEWSEHWTEESWLVIILKTKKNQKLIGSKNLEDTLLIKFSCTSAFLSILMVFCFNSFIGKLFFLAVWFMVLGPAIAGLSTFFVFILTTQLWLWVSFCLIWNFMATYILLTSTMS